MKAEARAQARGLLAAAAFLFAGAASAAPIQYIQTGIASGVLDGTPFGSLAPVPITVRATGDTANIQSCGGGCLFNDNLTASIEIGSLGTFDFITATRFYSNNPSIGFSRAGINGLDLFDLQPGIAWDMTTSLGPIVALGSLLQWSAGPMVTTGGVLALDGGTVKEVTFQAIVDGTTVVPVPGSLLLLGSSLAALVAVGRRRKAID